MKITDLFAHVIINHNLRAQPWTPPSSIYMALFNGSSIADLKVNTLTSEITFGGYARAEILLSPGADRITLNTNNVIFPIPTEEWQFTHYGLCGGATGNNLLAFGEMPPAEDELGNPIPWITPEGKPFMFPINNVGFEVEF